MSLEALRAISLVAGVLGVVTGTALTVSPGRLLRPGGRGRRWLIETDLVALLDRRRSIERPLYRHHRAFGAAVIVAAGASLAVLWRFGAYPAVLKAFAGVLGAWGAFALVFTAWVSAVFALGIGIFLLVRPSALKGLETVANRWFDPLSHAWQAGNSDGYDFIGRWVQRSPRVVGLLLFVAGLLCLDAFPN